MAFASLPAFVLGFHGCDQSVAESIFSGKTTNLKQSQNKYDWLGSGVYFWENSPVRALEYAQLRSQSPARSSDRIKSPAVIGAVIDLGYCLNLLDSQCFNEIRDAHQFLKKWAAAHGQKLPQNRPLRGGADLLLRDLDCAVINAVHQTRQQLNLPPYHSVRAAFIEGNPIYQGASFHDKNHIQLCIRSLDCIKGYFRPIPAAQ